MNRTEGFLTLARDGVMRFQNPRVRTKVTALLLSLVALWAFAAWVTLREGLNLLWVSTLDTNVSQPAESLITELQRERLLTSAVMAEPSSPDQRRNALADQRAKSLAASADFHRLITNDSVRRAASAVLIQRIETADRSVQRLVSLRKKVDAGQADRYATGDTFTQVIESIHNIHDALSGMDDQDFARDIRTLLQMARANELISQEHAFVVGALISGGLGANDRIKFTQLVGAQRYSLENASSALPADSLAAYERLTASDNFKRFRSLEDQLARAPLDGSRSFVPVGTWRPTADTVIAELDRLIVDGGDALVERATPLATAVMIRLALAGGLGLIAVIASIVLAITTARTLVRRLEELRTAALELAGRRLPGLVERLGRGDEVDVTAEAPPLAVGNDAIGQVSQAFNSVQETAIRVAVQQAELRRSYRGILLSLARRTQSLVHRQLTILDAMERRETEPEELADLFRVDHLATRMRRNAENLIVLSGASPGRAWRRSVPMVDVVRGALAEVEDYTQVTLMPMGEAELAGRAIGDVIHLLAELIENAVSFSPPYASVQVSGQEVAKGYVVEIEDRGLGMNPEDLADANQRIADPPEFKLTGTPRLGLFVVSRLASRHNIKVTLKASPYGGTTVVVLIPRELVDGDTDLDPGMEPMTDPTTDSGIDPLTGPVIDGAVPAPPAGVPPQASHDPREDLSRPFPPAPRDLSGLSPAEAPGLAPYVPGPALPVRNGRGGRTASHDGPSANGAPGPRHAEPRAAADEDAAPTFTPSGLPRRVAQAHLAPGLRQEPAAPSAGQQEEDHFSPEEIRRLMGSFQSGTERGRSEAAGLPGREQRDPVAEDGE
ncbi:nitrate- and nitrite sensing domain-containing protein [Sphaerisporangium krabiense]|uniref:histidine kinase n=1 Tax=Sphaerisporangium krabiense TaxID=763782 RepID=A0A7W8Z803_9ACTN|nr:nitrate- and nitrite sensing domain-containing protein [Sphaerisporangium krabiense]MBB5629025.1 signal transduction histidine kinase [Sphaerisporangium krabiense]